MEVHVLGCRGSMPTGGRDNIQFGSDTSAFMVKSGDDVVFLDAGTGICQAPDESLQNIYLFISHYHLDHVLGLVFFPYLLKKCNIHIYSDLNGIEAKTTLDRLFSPPFWPAYLEDYEANISFEKIEGEVKIGNLTVNAMKGNHPGESLIFKVYDGKSSAIYATDYEDTPDKDEALTEFANNADVLIYDGQYTTEEACKFKGFGHSTMEKGLEIAKKANVKAVYFTHHDPRHNDRMLKEISENILTDNERAYMAIQGEIISL